MKVSIKQYSQALLGLTDGKSEQDVLDVVKRFAEQLKKDGQLKNYKKIIENFSEVYNNAHGIVAAEITTSRKLESHQVHQIEKFIKEKYLAKEVEIKNVIDENIKGGVIVRVGDEVLDASVENQLRKLKKELVR